MNRTDHSSETSAQGKRHSLSRGVVKVMGAFTGTQMIVILCSVIKMKLVALWLQAGGVGLFGIYNSTIESISTLTDMGLRQSAVRDAAIAARESKRLAMIAAVIRRWSVVAGLFGAVVISALSPVLSIFFFKTAAHWWSFAILSGAMLMNALLNGEQAILQGSGMLKRIIRSTLWASIAGLAVSVPMFYFLGETSVMLSILAYSAAGLGFIAAVRYRPEVKVRPSREEIMKEGSSFVKLGASMAVATFVANIANLLFLAYLNNVASTAEVGYFQAGSTVVIRYVGLIFSAIGMEFYPRLSASSFSMRRISVFVSHEILLLLLVITPVIMLFLLMREIVVDVLYSPEFMVIVPFISWAILSSVFKAMSWCMAFTILAKGDGRTFIITESVDSAIGLVLNIVMYHAFGLAGVGVSYILWFLIYTLIVGRVYYHRYGLTLSRKVLGGAAGSLALCGAAFLCMETLPFFVNCILIGGGALTFVFPLKRMLGKR